MKNSVLQWHIKICFGESKLHLSEVHQKHIILAKKKPYHHQSCRKDAIADRIKNSHHGADRGGAFLPGSGTTMDLCHQAQHRDTKTQNSRFLSPLLRWWRLTRHQSSPHADGGLSLYLKSTWPILFDCIDFIRSSKMSSLELQTVALKVWEKCWSVQGSCSSTW